MTSERSSLLSTRPHTHVTKKQDVSFSNPHHRRRQQGLRLNQQPSYNPDLLSDSDHPVLPVREYPLIDVTANNNRVGLSRHPTMNSTRGDFDEDLIQIEESSTLGTHSVSGAPLSSSIRKLNARIQVRNKVSSPVEREQIVMGSFDEDDSENEHDNDGSYTKSDENIVKGTLIDLHVEKNETNNDLEAIFQHPPIDDLSNGTGATNKKINSGRDTFNSTSNRSGGNKLDLSPRPMYMKSQRVMSDPLSPVASKAPTVRGHDATPDRAKRAISTLFGASVAGDDINHSSEASRSLLDNISDVTTTTCSGHRNLDVKIPSSHIIGLQAKPQSFTYNIEHDGQNAVSSPTNDHRVPMSSTQRMNRKIDIDDPFSYFARSTMTHRRDTQMNNSSTAKSWFGKSLNYTTSSIPHATAAAMTVGMNGDVNKGVMEDHQLLDRLHQTTLDADRPGYMTIFEKFTGGELKNHLNRLNCSLCLSYAFTSAASCVPISLIPTIAMDVLSAKNAVGDGANGDDGEFDPSLEADATLFASTVATYAILGTAFGKFINGPLGDIFGARRVACLYALLLSLSLTMLSWCRNSWSIICCCALIEFFQSVQWPCITVILAAHYGNGSVRTNSDSNVEGASSMNSTESKNFAGRYEKGIYIASLGSRCGALFAGISTTMLLSYVQDSWRVIARLAAMGSFFGFVIFYSSVTDSPGKLHDPQNPVKDLWIDVSNNYSNRNQRYMNDTLTTSDIIEKVHYFIRISLTVLRRNVVPSLRSVLSNYTFWIVAVAHSGGYMVCSSVRILGTYLRDTSYGNISGDKAGVVTMFLSVGVLTGLAVGGNAFANLSSNAKARKNMVANLYIMTVAMCYTLSFLALPFIRKAIHSSAAVALLQVAASFCMGAGVAVQVYCIPAIVSCTFGANKGLYTSYTDGVACIVSSIVWRIVGNAVEEGNPQGTGWFYGWAAVALLVILAGLLMVQFVEHYFCRGGFLDRLQHTNKYSNLSLQTPNDSNRSFEHLAESGKRLWESRPSFLRPSTTFTKVSPEVESILSIGDDDDDDTSTIVFEDVTLPVNFGDIENDELSRNPNDIKQQLEDLLELEGNDICVDCQAPYPRWVSIILPNRIALSHRGASKPLSREIGCVCCSECAGLHRKLGTHLVFVRSVDHDSFKVKELVALRRGGNVRVNKIYEALLKDRSAKPSPASIPSQRERFISTKYEKKLWYYASDIQQIDMNESYLENETSLSTIELVSNHPKGNSQTSTSAFEQPAPFDKKMHDVYVSFVHDDANSESDPPVGSYDNIRKREGGQSISSEDSEDWHIDTDEKRGLDDLINL